MKKTRSRLFGHLSFANVIALIALFVALGGVGYAATSINGNEIKKQTIGAGKLKNGTLTSKQVKQDALTGSVIDESTLATVPAAQTAVSATSAASATTAQSTTTAKIATEAETLQGLSAEDLELSCAAATEPYGGMCWDEDVRPAKSWIAAAIECGDAGGRLPTLSELIAYVARPGKQVSESNWSADVIDLPGGKELVLVRDETTTASSPSSPGTLGYRCLFYPSN